MDGYAASRHRVTHGWADANVRNAAVLTGDVHRNWANDVRVDYRDSASPVVGSELVCTSSAPVMASDEILAAGPEVDTESCD